ncbi:MAG: hypothetical protein K0U93_28010 [Gammaproteobacteria bacterium]|nr:hypothetical protein [Gammaproteobacteria bacterium]
MSGQTWRVSHTNQEDLTIASEDSRRAKRRRTRKFFRRVAFAAAVVCAIAASVKLAPVADYVTRSSSDGPVGQWTPIAIFVWVVLGVIAGVAGYLFVRTIGWWMLWRQSNDDYEPYDGTAGELASGTDWNFPEGDLLEQGPEAETEPSAAFDRAKSGRRAVRRRSRRSDS